MNAFAALVAALALIAPVAASATPRSTVHDAHDRYANMETSYAVSAGTRATPVVDDVAEVMLNLRGAASHAAQTAGASTRRRR